ncbi:unnamed protein product [Clonostachys rosea]|uniref:Uncharacterized protein n=1 Tax=Bionectria ochroleuca TaxID=29856 RepID=A0ABY6UA61_BIOOC|nr:unnamed protein product [Clonostachys rosea]
MSHHSPSIRKLILALAASVHVAYADYYDYDDDEYYARGWDDIDEQTPMLTTRCWYYSCHYNGSWHLTGPAVAGIVLFSILMLIFMVIIVRHCFIDRHETDAYYQQQNYQEAYLPQQRPAAPVYSYPANRGHSGSGSSISNRQEMREHTRERRRYAAMPVVPLTIPQNQGNQVSSAPPPWEPREPLPAYMTDTNNPKVAPADEKANNNSDGASDYSYR